ncbi:UNVERIFIED_CONTAM: Cytosolic sulfotransferase 5 [Sesamum calycinum]|uniref:Sulfotransferase n=1 Tax=Sesamum calycinum TaxID=2727403 RepID=A0AAW2KYV3_9LAMI
MEDFSFDLELSSLPKEKWWGDDEYLFQLGGFWHLPQLIHGVHGVINHFQPLPSDIILASFPKTGTTWLKALLYSIVNRSSKHHIPTSNTNHSRRILSTHIPYQLLAKTLDSSECRVIYVTRNPKDTLVSTWHFVNKWARAKEERWPFEVAVEKFCRGLIPSGPYYDHVTGYRNLSLDRPKYAHFLTYEELKNDPKTHVKKLAEFLGSPFQVEDVDAQVEEIVNGCRFEVLSNHEVNKAEGFPARIGLPSNSFFRKGVVGDYEEYMSADVVDKIDALTREKFHSLGSFTGSSYEE